MKTEFRVAKTYKVQSECNSDVEVGHACSEWGYLFDDKISEIFYCLQDLEEKSRSSEDGSRSYRRVFDTQRHA